MIRKILNRRFALAALGITVAGCFFAEVAARYSGVGDFPLIQRSATVGYIPAPNQSGAFLNRRQWVFNERSMAVARPFRPGPDDILLIGDSLVVGGNGIDQKDRLGASIESETGCVVWPIGAGSWALSNELAEIMSNKDLLGLRTIVFISNRDDFGRASVLENEYTHPTKHPWSVALYAIRRMLWPISENTPSELSPEATTKWHGQLAAFLNAYKGRIVWVTHSMTDELKAPPPVFAELGQRIGGRATIVDSARDSRWKASLYRDIVHPTPEGNRVLGKIISERLPRCKPG